jgi:hypothetical protein
MSWVLVGHTYHPKLHRRMRSGGSWFQATPGKKKFKRPTSTGKKLGVLACSYHPSKGRKHKIGGLQSKPAGTKRRPHLKHNQSKEGWKHGLNYRAPA